MRPPSIRLTSLGDVRETVSVYAITYDKDVEGNPIRKPGPVSGTYPAVVTRMLASLTDENGTDQSIGAYKVMIFSHADPKVIIDQVLGWTDSGLAVHSMLAQGETISAGPGAWQVMAIEVGPDVDGYVGPFNLQPQ